MSRRNQILPFIGLSLILFSAILIRILPFRILPFQILPFRQQTTSFPKIPFLNPIPEPSDGSNGFTDVIGIEFGDTYSRVAVHEKDHERGQGKVIVLANEQGKLETPNYVAYTSQGILVGQPAKDQAVNNPKNTIYDVRRLIGRKFSDLDFQAYIKTLPYDVVEKDGKPLVKIQVKHETKLVYPEEIAAKILEKFKNKAEEYLQRKVAHAVISVPAYYNDIQKQATKDAGIIAGLNVLRLVNEPTAAAIAYDLDRREAELQFLVYNLQSKTFDVTVEDMEQGVYEIRSKADAHLGGDDFDDALLNYAIQFIHENYDFHVGESSKYMEILREKVESAKETLQTQESTTIQVGIDAYTEVTITFSNYHLQHMHKQLFEQTLVSVEKVLKETNMTELPIGALIVSGNPAHIAIVKPLLSAYFPNAKIYDELPSDQLVVQGASVQAMVLSDESGLDFYPLMVVTPVSLGVETVGGVYEKIVSRNYVIPLRKTKIFSTVRDNQEKVVIKVFGGERALTNNNKFVTEVELTGLPPAPKGMPRIEVVFEITEEVWTIKANLVNEGEMKIAAEEKVPIPMQNLWADSKVGGYEDSWPWEMIDKMIMDSEKFWDEDEFVRKDPSREPREGGEDRFGIIRVQETVKECSGI